MASNLVLATATLTSRTGRSVYREPGMLNRATINDFRPPPANVDRAVNLLEQAGFTIEARTDVGLSLSAERELFEDEFGVSIRRQRVRLHEERGIRGGFVEFDEASERALMSNRLADVVETIRLSVPGIPFHDAAPPVPNPGYYHIDVVTNVPDLLNATQVHNDGTNGAGVRVSIVDSGFLTRVSETTNAAGIGQVITEHDVRAVDGVWLDTDPNHTGTNYFAGGAFAGTTVTLGTPVPQPHAGVEIVYSCVHPHYTSQGYAIDDLRAAPTWDVNSDDIGHGTGMAANVLAMAPGATLSAVAGWNTTGFQRAVQFQDPDIITCSWGTVGHDAQLHLEVTNAVANDIIVVFAAGNGHTDSGGTQPIAHPDAILVGGAYPIQGGAFRASNYASSFDSAIYTDPQRHVPDVVGLVGEQPNAVLIMLPTQPQSDLDDDHATGGPFPSGDNTQADDGWVVCSGTSAAAPQVAGTAALLLERFPNLTPAAIKNVLENSARDVQTGTSSAWSGGDAAEIGWDAATGFGLIDAEAAVDYLETGAFNPFIRDSVEDNGTEPVGADRLWASPDIIVRTDLVIDPDERLGQTVKHRHDLSDAAEDGQTNYVYLRIQNRGLQTDAATVDLYFTEPGMFADPTQWIDIQKSIAFPALAPGEFRVIGPVDWPDAKVPTPGHFCLIARLDSATDAGPDLSTITSANDFVNLVRNSNNMAWRNIQVVDLIPGGFSTYSFYMEGPPGSIADATLHVDLSRFAPGATVLTRIVRRLADGAAIFGMDVASQSSLYTTLVHQGGIGEIAKMTFKSGERSKVLITYTVPETLRDGDYPLMARLVVDGEQVGAYTHVARISRFPYVGNRSTKEVHRKNCSWLPQMSPYNRVALGDLEQAHRRGFDNCAFCIGGSTR